MAETGQVDIGRRLRAERDAQRLTLTQLADASGLTKGYLSKVERGRAMPSVASLLRLCDALGLSPGELFEHSHDRDLVRGGEYPPIGFGGEHMEEALLTPPRERRLQVIHSLIHPGGGSGDESYELPSDVEFLFVVRGRLTLVIDGNEHQLADGDAVTFLPSAPHSFVNPSASEDTEVLWILAPALPIRDARGGQEITR
jgi:transcriptional regulator with XRE-family HTH domain